MLALSLFPTINEVPKEFSASLLWNFRIASLGIYVVLWSVLGVTFGWLTERQLLTPRVRHNARLQS
ncbi:CbtA family protein [Pseudomonas helleri]|mgnify:CR=1 FL=1|uniref:CbtA family protein n=1 Tax=Pseudomonas helleri TaxID=1608996 RepID=UPI003F95218A